MSSVRSTSAQRLPEPAGLMADIMDRSLRDPEPDRLQVSERNLELCEGMIDIAAALFNVSGRDLRQPGRASLPVTRVRQIAMYVAHVVLQLRMIDIAAGFGRDRKTVAHAIHFVEDMRDDEDFDSIVATAERVARAAFRDRAAA